MTPKPSHIVGEALEGTYRVYYDPGEIGNLKLSNGEYSFTPLVPPEQIPQAAIDRLFFVRNPKGRYSVEYRPPVSANTRLEDLNDFTYLTLIRFSPLPDTDEATPGPNRRVTDRVFLIAADNEQKLLIFHSVDNEFQRWTLLKPWE